MGEESASALVRQMTKILEIHSTIPGTVLIAIFITLGVTSCFGI